MHSQETYEPFDQLLGAYFCWADKSNVTNEAASPSVEEFLKQHTQWSHNESLVAQLREFLDETHELRRIAASTLSHWIDEDTTATHLSVRAESTVATLPHSVGDYELIDEIGRGGMGVVYRAHQKSLDRIVCAKMILTGRLAGQRDIERFLAEAKAMASLRHPNIVTVYDVGSHEDQYFYSMEFVPGETLAAMVQDGPLTAKLAATFTQSVSEAIAYAHQQGVLHRDLKPSNVIVDQASIPRVMDFGLARGIDAGGLTSTGALAGTPSYMAPELTKGDRTAGVECDIYGLGALLYELLTARPPFQGETPLDTLLQVRENEPARPSLLNPRVPRDLETICLKCLSKSPSHRYDSADAVAQELGRFLRHEPIVARPVSPLSRLASWCRRNPLPVALVATVITALLTISGVLLHSYQQQVRAFDALETERDNLVAAKRETDDANQQLKQERNRLTKTQKQLGDYLSLSRIRRAAQAVNHGDLLEVEEILENLKPVQGQPDRRGWEWHYLRAISRQYKTSHQLPHPIRTSVALDEGIVATLDVAEQLRILDSSDQPPHVVEQLEETYGCIAWNQHAQQIAIGLNTGSVALVDTHDLTANSEATNPRATNPDTKRSHFKNSASMTQISTGSDQPVRSVAWNESGTLLACGLDDGTLVLVNPTTKETHGAQIHSDGINSVSWSYDERLIATASDDYTAQVTSLTEFEALNSQAQNKDEQSTEITRFNEWVNAVAFAPNELALAVVSRAGQFQVWDLARSEDREDDSNARQLAITSTLRFSRSNSRGTEISTVAWSDDSQHLVTAGESGEVSMWSAETGQRERELHGHTQQVRTLAWQGKHLISAGDDGTVKFWDSVRSPEGQIISNANTPVRFVTWHPSLPLAAWRDVDGVVTVWDEEHQRIPTRFAESITSATAVAWHPTKPLLALSREESVLVYDLEDDSTLIQFDHQLGDFVWHIRWSPDGKTLATSGASGQLSIWNYETQDRMHVFDEFDIVSTFCWNHEATLLYVVDGLGSVHVATLADAATTLLHAFDEELAAKFASLSQDGTRLAVTTESGLIQILSTIGEKHYTLRGHQGTTWTCVWASDARRLISGGQDGSIRVWHMDSQQEALRIPAHAAAVWSLDVNHQRQLISASADGTVRRWGEM